MSRTLKIASERYDSDMYENDISISGVYFKDNEEGKEYIAGSDSYCLDLSGNELIQGYQQLVVDTLYVALKDFAYRPYEASVKPMPYLYPMDKISYVDSKGVTHSTIVTNVNFVINGMMTTALKDSPAAVQFILIDPKRVELVDYKELPHTLRYSSEPGEMVQALQEAIAITDKSFCVGTVT